MASHHKDMNLRAATLAGLLLAIVSLGLLAIAGSATGVAALAGGIGLVVATSLLGLTVLARRWDRQRGSAYVRTVMDQDQEAADDGSAASRATASATTRDAAAR
ncbi:MAG: hypothetical protein KDC46_03375 [Thermoleophilia bacterium]|nr:hypothetical protein [Thermoleophilia bacterium]